MNMRKISLVFGIVISILIVYSNVCLANVGNVTYEDFDEKDEYTLRINTSGGMGGIGQDYYGYVGNRNNIKVAVTFVPNDNDYVYDSQKGEWVEVNPRLDLNISNLSVTSSNENVVKVTKENGEIYLNYVSKGSSVISVTYNFKGEIYSVKSALDVNGNDSNEDKKSNVDNRQEFAVENQKSSTDDKQLVVAEDKKSSTDDKQWMVAEDKKSSTDDKQLVVAEGKKSSTDDKQLVVAEDKKVIATNIKTDVKIENELKNNKKENTEKEQKAINNINAEKQEAILGNIIEENINTENEKNNQFESKVIEEINEATESNGVNENNIVKEKLDEQENVNVEENNNNFVKDDQKYEVVLTKDEVKQNSSSNTGIIIGIAVFMGITTGVVITLIVVIIRKSKIEKE